MTHRLRRTLLAGALLFPLTGCGLSFQTLPKVSSGVGPSYTVKATFTEVLNLPSDAQVRIGPQVVGLVSDIQTENFVAKLDLAIKQGVQLPVGTTAQVRFDNPLGDQYVLLSLPEQPSGRMLGAGEPLAQELTSSAPSVEDAFAALSAVLNGGGINQLQTIVQEFNLSLDGNQQQTRDLLGQINTAVTSLAEGRTAVTNALTAIDNLSTQLNAGTAQITSGIQALAPAIGTLADQNGEISALLTNFADLSVTANRIVEQSGQDSVRGAQALLPVLQQLVGVKQRLGQDLRDLAEFSRTTIEKAPGGYLQFALNLNVDLPPGPAQPQAALRPGATQTGDLAVRGLLQTGLLP